MKRVHFSQLSLLLLLVWGLVAVVQAAKGGKSQQEPELPQAHEGFSWQVLEEIKGAFLILDGWHFVSEQNEGTQSYFITLEDLTRSGSFLPAFP